MPDLLRIATRDIIRWVPDDETAFAYRGDMTTGTQVRLTRGVSFWPLGGSRQMLSGTLEIDNRSGYYDNLLTIDVRDRKIVFGGVKDQHVFEDGQRLNLVTAIADTIEASNDTTIRISITDPMKRLEKPLGRNTDPELEDTTGRKTPVLIGLARNIRPPLANQAYPIFRVNDSALAAIGIVRSRAFPLSTEQPEPQWDFALDNAGFQMFVSPHGPITCDASTAGVFQLPPSPTDVLQGLGLLAVDNWGGQSGSNPGGTITGMPDGRWLYRTRNSGVPDSTWRTEPITQNGETYASIRTGGVPGQTSTGWIEWEWNRNSSNPPTPALFEAGKTYRWTIDRDIAFFGQNNLVGGFQSGGQIVDRGYFQLVAGPPAGPGSSANPNAYPQNRIIAEFKSFDPSAAPGIYSGTWTCPAGADGQRLILRLFGFNAFVRFRHIEMYEVKQPEEGTLEGIGLKGFIEDVIQRSGEPVSGFNLPDLDGIDTHESDIGYWTDDASSTLGVMRRALDSYTADAFTGRDGTVKFTRLIDPNNGAVRHIVNGDNIKGQMRIRIAQASGLTTQATARKNWFVFRDSDFVDNFDDVPSDMRARFSAQGQFTVNATIPDPSTGFTELPGFYGHAIYASPLETLFDQAQPAKNEIQRVVNYFMQIRFIVDLECFLGTPPEPGEIVRVEYPRYPQFLTGRNMQILTVTDNVTGEAGELSFTLRLIG